MNYINYTFIVGESVLKSGTLSASNVSVNNIMLLGFNTSSQDGNSRNVDPKTFSNIRTAHMIVMPCRQCLLEGKKC